MTHCTNPTRITQVCHLCTKGSHHVTGCHCDELNGEHVIVVHKGHMINWDIVMHSKKSVILVHKGHIMWMGFTVVHSKVRVSSLSTRVTWCYWVTVIHSKVRVSSLYTRVTLCDLVSPWCTRRPECHPSPSCSRRWTPSYRDLAGKQFG